MLISKMIHRKALCQYSCRLSIPWPTIRMPPAALAAAASPCDVCLIRLRVLLPCRLASGILLVARKPSTYHRSIPLRRMSNTTPGAAAPILKSGALHLASCWWPENHQHTTWVVGCGSILLRRMSNTTPGAAALHPAGGQKTSETKRKPIREPPLKNDYASDRRVLL